MERGKEGTRKRENEGTRETLGIVMKCDVDIDVDVSSAFLPVSQQAAN